ncbi:SDR family NAD(P)-dependent oxidoreductase [Falsiroseomonas selenitidurans]|uniref:SDR family oxidoreductase n=1 Tax=Falsiroseomonas selenitidurans TaxID=2716335 RepID=A0ABX1E0G2_9PROT|nr:SDR family oxidoreductase [Falsiroseomonas selenitidurans]NKC30135.1 SDR family oxidoreductase [Falsiroseomonas selenitidurans]
MDLGYQGRRVLVIGASTGIGFAAAKLLAAEGAELVIASRDPAAIADAAARIGAETGRSPATATADITQEGAADRLLAEVAGRWGALDGLVDAVGGSIRSGFEALSDADWLTNYQFNVLSAVRAVRAALPLLRQGQAPSVVLLGAAASRMPYPNQIVSNVHKAGLLGLTKTLAGEYAAEGIRVNCVAPGRTLTRLWQLRAEKLAAESGRSVAEVIADFAHEVPLGRFATAEEVAVMVLWLGSPRAAYVTGQTVNVDGGIARGLL